ncbi:MAG TPA: carboxylating nicotinate-nucleotide diphosphorylase [Dehalococcoidia bacterium]|nr:carboxylating nicotinate-nucleotide diphosphorylase [Dehalococcoidia bacterium]
MDYFEIQTRKIVKRALEEDLGWGDVTTDNLIPDDVDAKGSIVSRRGGIVCGVGVVKMVFESVDPDLELQVMLEDGESMRPEDVIAVVKGKAASILRGERVALNFLQRMSGIATETARYVEAVRGLPVRIADTRKTAPGLRVIDKYAVRVGGGLNHRLHLGDGVLIKDNHLAILNARGVLLKEVVSRIQQNSPRILHVEVEAKSVDEAEAAAEAGADIILLDNMDIDMMKAATEAIAGRALIEASGGMTLDIIRGVAETGVDFISVGALTHSVKSMDIALELKLL